MQAAPENQVKDFATGQVWIDSDGIVHAVVKEHAELGLDDAREWVRHITTVGEGKRRPVLVDYGRMKGMSRAARLHFASAECASAESAAALVVSSPLAKAIGNFFLGLNKPIMPTKLFSDKSAAMAWLRGFL